jgi:hypothetical protein
VECALGCPLKDALVERLGQGLQYDGVKPVLSDQEGVLADGVAALVIEGAPVEGTPLTLIVPGEGDKDPTARRTPGDATEQVRGIEVSVGWTPNEEKLPLAART